MNNKLCRTCGKKKPASDFGIRAASNDGLASKCKMCQSDYDKSRANNPSRVEARKLYQKTPRGIAAANAAKKRYIEANPKKRKAHIAVGNALRDGRLRRGKCEVCGNRKAEAHHDNYDYPLDVRWLCDTHHKLRHKELRAAGINP